MKSCFSRQVPARRTLLCESKIVGRTVPHHAGEHIDHELALFWGLEPRYLHFAYNHLAPWHLWVQEMTEVDDPDELHSASPMAGEIPLKAAGG